MQDENIWTNVNNFANLFTAVEWVISKYIYNLSISLAQKKCDYNIFWSDLLSINFTTYTLIFFIFDTEFWFFHHFEILSEIEFLGFLLQFGELVLILWNFLQRRFHTNKINWGKIVTTVRSNFLCSIFL